MRVLSKVVLCAGLFIAMASSLQAGGPEQRHVLTLTSDGRIVVDDIEFASWQEYVHSDFFRDNGLRCGTRPKEPDAHAAAAFMLDPDDCAYRFTNPSEEYDPSVVKYRIPVVVHVIRRDDGVTGHVPESMIHSQIDILNEDYLALVGSNGENGTDIQIEFYLATEDPAGNPTTGITYSDNSTWFSDGGSYWTSLAWDTHRYMNVYTNNASGALGYVPNLPQGGIVGSSSDRVVILWSAFGRDAPIGPPYDQGRTLTHEVGHYLGLFHPFEGCDTPTTCYSDGDYVCDTTPHPAAPIAEPAASRTTSTITWTTRPTCAWSCSRPSRPAACAVPWNTTGPISSRWSPAIAATAGSTTVRNATSQSRPVNPGPARSNASRAIPA